MNKEEICKAALQYAQDKYCQEDNRTPQYMIAQIHAGRDGFKAGAEWRINSVWKGVNDIPEFDRVILLVMDNVTITTEVSYISTWESLQKSGKKAIWAYVDDLIPEKDVKDEKPKYKVSPFDVETAKKVMNGEIQGIIRTLKGEKVRIVCWDFKSQSGLYPIIAMIDCGIYEEERLYTSEGKYRSWEIDVEYDLVIELEQ